MTKLLLISSLALMFTLGGCASIVSKSSYPVNISSNPENAKIEITDEDGRLVFEGQTPAIVTLETKAGYFSGHDYTILFAKEGFNKHRVTLKSGVDGWYIWGNLIFGLVIGWLIVDPATGAMWKLPTDVSIHLQQGASQQSSAGLRVATLDEVPQALRSELIRVK
ncbi:MAG: hypothetical protein ACR2RB_20905 [Gammaproteobacteria bacterium]